MVWRSVGQATKYFSLNFQELHYSWMLSSLLYLECFFTVCQNIHKIFMKFVEGNFAILNQSLLYFFFYWIFKAEGWDVVVVFKIHPIAILDIRFIIETAKRRRGYCTSLKRRFNIFLFILYIFKIWYHIFFYLIFINFFENIFNVTWWVF